VSFISEKYVVRELYNDHRDVTPVAVVAVVGVHDVLPIADAGGEGNVSHQDNKYNWSEDRVQCNSVLYLYEVAEDAVHVHSLMSFPGPGSDFRVKTAGSEISPASCRTWNTALENILVSLSVLSIFKE
jgi:hypothetical protein